MGCGVAIHHKSVFGILPYDRFALQPVSTPGPIMEQSLDLIPFKTVNFPPLIVKWPVRKTSLAQSSETKLEVN